MYISVLKCGPGLLFIGPSWPSVQVQFDMPGVWDEETDEVAKVERDVRP
jgi:hypothetical protein